MNDTAVSPIRNHIAAVVRAVHQVFGYALRRSLLLLVVGLWGREPEYATRGDDRAFPGFLAALQERVAPLEHSRCDRLPMILWESMPVGEVQAPEVYAAMLARGLSPHIKMDERCLPAAQAIQAAGGPVIMMQGAGGPWPARLQQPAEAWQHQFVEGYDWQAHKHWSLEHLRPCLSALEGWRLQGDRVRTVMRAFRDAGVMVDAVWMDWEGDPYGVSYQFAQASQCVRCRHQLPEAVLASAAACERYCWRLYLALLDSYLAAPVKEIFPAASTTNWMAVFSTEERPVRHWDGRVLPPSGPALLTATNPVAYGNTKSWRFWSYAFPLDQEHVDQFYTHLLLQQVSANAANSERLGPEKACIPWVSRWCPDDPNPRIPVLSRERYREVLRHIWLRGADSMQLFNASWDRKGHAERMFTEVEDAIRIYDEMLAYRAFLEAGKVMNTETPAKQSDEILWSGLRLPDQAIVRLFKQGVGEESIALEPWDGVCFDLVGTAAGESYLLLRTGGMEVLQP